MIRQPLLKNGSPVATLSALAVLGAVACGDDPVAPDYALVAEGEHVQFWSIEPDATEAEIQLGLNLAEQAFADVADFLGPANTPDRKVVVYLEGELGPDDIVYVEADGAIRLFRTAEDFGGYWAVLPLVMAHSFRAEWWQRVGALTWQSFGFLEEGFAAYVAARVDPDNLGFPFYGYPEDVVAGYWVLTGQHVPLQVLRDRHAELSGLCLFQAFPLRASWFHYLEETYGRDKVFELAYASSEPGPEAIADIFGAGTSELDAAWTGWLVSRYLATDGADRLAESYRADLREYANYFGFDDIYVCRDGTDF